MFDPVLARRGLIPVFLIMLLDMMRIAIIMPVLLASILTFAINNLIVRLPPHIVCLSGNGPSPAMELPAAGIDGCRKPGASALSPGCPGSLATRIKALF